MDKGHHLPASGRDRLSILAAYLRRLFPAQEARPFAQLLIDIDEAAWQAKLSRITLRCA